jgi:hypothetical protein
VFKLVSSYAKILRGSAALTVATAAFVPMATTAAASAAPPPGQPSIVLDSVGFFREIPFTGNCDSEVTFTVTGLNSGKPHQWFASGEAVSDSFSPQFFPFYNGTVQPIPVTRFVEGALLSFSGVGIPSVPNTGATSDWTMTLKDLTGETVATSTLAVTDTC